MNASQWQEAFDKYQHTPQFRLINSGFSLSDFKFIFFWEWFHRLWARMVGVVFLVGFAWLLMKGKIRSGLVRPLIILFLLGALQGVVGWIMVASGLAGDAIYVAPTKLAMHFILRWGWSSILSGWVYSCRCGRTARFAAPGLRRWTIAILVVLFFQLVYGALMAGHKAANVAPTWPDINGDFVPPGMFRGSWLEALVGNRITVQFIHRTLAYILFVLVLFWTVKAIRLPAVAGQFPAAPMASAAGDRDADRPGDQQPADQSLDPAAALGSVRLAGAVPSDHGPPILTDNGWNVIPCDVG